VVLYLTTDVDSVLNNVDRANFVLYKYVKLNGSYQLWIRAGCLAFRGEVTEDKLKKILEELEKMKKLGKNVIEFEQVISEDLFFIG